MCIHKVTASTVFALFSPKATSTASPGPESAFCSHPGVPKASLPLTGACDPPDSLIFGGELGWGADGGELEVGSWKWGAGGGSSSGCRSHPGRWTFLGAAKEGGSSWADLACPFPSSTPGWASLHSGFLGSGTGFFPWLLTFPLRPPAHFPTPNSSPNKKKSGATPGPGAQLGISPDSGWGLWGQGTPSPSWLSS